MNQLGRFIYRSQKLSIILNSNLLNGDFIKLTEEELQKDIDYVKAKSLLSGTENFMNFQANP